jgi:hypothetical protein
MLPDRIFFTGVPGSKWSGIAQFIEENIPGMNTSDRSEDRQYVHGKFTGHKGAYFGEGMEFPADINAVDFAHTSLDGCRLIKSHEWSYMIQEIKDRRPKDWIMLVYRNDYESFHWWKEAGGFNITYPSYESYVDDITMKAHIAQQNLRMIKYTSANNIMWSPFNKEFVEREFKFPMDADYSRWNGIYVSIIK